VSGLGICAFPDYMAWQVPDLVRVLPDHKVPTFDTCFSATNSLSGKACFR
jgi:DNA-binding transcriptional LysR family regulator